MFKFMEIEDIEAVFVKDYLAAIVTVLKKSDDVCQTYMNTPIYETKCERIITEKIAKRIEEFIRSFIIDTCIGYLDNHPDTTLDIINESLLEIKFLEDHDLLYVKYNGVDVYSTSWSDFSSYTKISKKEYPGFEKILLEIRNNIVAS